MPAVRGDDFGIEFVGGLALCGHSCSIASIHMPSSDYLVWIDLEMTGLDPTRDRIIEIAVVITDTRSRRRRPGVRVHQVTRPSPRWTLEHGHTRASGLTDRVSAPR